MSSPLRLYLTGSNHSAQTSVARLLAGGFGFRPVSLEAAERAGQEACLGPVVVVGVRGAQYAEILRRQGYVGVRVDRADASARNAPAVRIEARNNSMGSDLVLVTDRTGRVPWCKLRLLVARAALHTAERRTKVSGRSGQTSTKARTQCLPPADLEDAPRSIGAGGTVSRLPPPPTGAAAPSARQSQAWRDCGEMQSFA